MHVANPVLTNTCVTMAFNNATKCGRLSAASPDSCANTRLNNQEIRKSSINRGTAGVGLLFVTFASC